ncbi:MAG: cytochrome c oxidase subunit 3 [Hyphomicrobiaceae bacterium]
MAEVQAQPHGTAAADHPVKHHDYHLVDPSPWPAIGSAFVLAIAVGLIVWMRSMGGGPGLFGLRGPTTFFIGAAGLSVTAFFWWRDVVREAHKGDHTPVVQLHLRYGMVLFIASEVMFFVAWFWAYFDAALYPGTAAGLPIVGPDGSIVPSDKSLVGTVERNALTGGHWPPKPAENFKHTFDPWGLPLVNTLILLLSGTTVTWAHHSLLENNRKGLIWGLVCTVVLGVMFTLCQAYEYGHAAFNYAGHIYGATFFMATGFHGAHVIIGTIFLFVCLMRALAGHFSPQQHFGLEAAAWYWHFVDVVWLFLFTFIYVWGGGVPGGGQ